MTPAEANLHDIAESFCAPRVVREVCGACGGKGIVASSTWDRPQMRVTRCPLCNAKGYIVTERTAP